MDHHLIEKRARKWISFCSPKMDVVSPLFDSSGDIVKKQTSIETYGYKNPDDCNDYDFGLVGIPSDTTEYATEHVLEFQLLTIFLKAKSDEDGFKYKGAKGDLVNLCDYMKKYWSGDIVVNVDGDQGRPIELLPKTFPGKDNKYVSEFMLLEKYVNGMKERVSTTFCSHLPRDSPLTRQTQMWNGQQLAKDKKMKTYIDDTTQINKAFKKMRDVISAWKYHQDATTKAVLKEQSDRVAALFDSLEDAIAAKDNKYAKIELKDAWNSFMKGRANKAGAAAETFLDNWLKNMNNAWTDGDENSDPNTKSDPKAKSDPNSKTSRLAKLQEARDSMGKWASPF